MGVGPTSTRATVGDHLPGIRFLHLVRPYSFVSPFEGGEFALLLLVSDPDVTGDEQASLSKSFVAQGCRYACCTGHGASSWDDSIDLATVIAELDGERDPQRTVMTTWHDESLADAVDFFLNHTAFEDFVPYNRIGVTLGGAHGTADGLRLAVLEATGPEDANLSSRRGVA